MKMSADVVSYLEVAISAVSFLFIGYFCLASISNT
jgi:hypothetical protein